MIVTIENLSGMPERVRLPETGLVLGEGRIDSMGTGIDFVGCWVGPRSRRIIIGARSRWQGSNGQPPRGEYYYEIAHWQEAPEFCREELIEHLEAVGLETADAL
jgi:hypothetical protein